VIARVEPLTTTRKVAGPFDYKLPEAPVEVGSVVRIPFGRQSLDGVVTGLAASTEVPEEKLVAPVSVGEQSIPPDLVECALWLAAEYCSTPARALQLVVPPKGRPKTELWWTPAGTAEGLTERQAAVLARLPGPTDGDLAILRRLEAKGLVEEGRRLRRRAPLVVSADDRAVALTDEQEAALAALGERALLHGVTGSGKTEVYLRAAERVLGEGRGVIVLVPEIALTPQTVARFTARFGDTVALLHSGLSDGERFDEWARLRAGEARIAVGPRSAVFAPVEDLGLVIVDEEHDPSFKSGDDPRYDARLVARWRAAYTGAQLLVGTATPRPETWRELPRLTLSRRVDGQSLPQVDVVDMRGPFHHPLHPDTQRALTSARKAIVLLNRRGWSNFVTCRDCGKVWSCPNCDVALVLHRAAGRVSCHHCGHTEAAPARCDACGSTAVARHGAGTERLEAELAEMLDVPVFRLDADTGAAKDAIPRLVAAFREAPAGVLLGTQLVAKGHDFPDVTLGVVVDADQTLRFPDFRAEERTFALVAQLAGRAGRGAAGGRVIVQTLSPDATSIRHAARHDAPGFLTEELERRESLRYPPFADLIRVVCTHQHAGAALAAATAIAERVDAGERLGPAPLFRLRGRERFQLVLKTTERARAIAEVGAAVEAVAVDRAHRDVALSVDVDPQ
jgi:primosomal protein N' (replication factor Y)